MRDPSQPSPPQARKIFDGDESWEIEIAFRIHCMGEEPEKAWFCVIHRWADCGNLRPLRAALAKNTIALDTAALVGLEELIEQDRVVIKSRWSNRPPSPERFAQALVAALRYEKHSKTDGSDEAFKEIAAEIGTTANAVREAVTILRNAKRKYIIEHHAIPPAGWDNHLSAANYVEPPESEGMPPVDVIDTPQGFNVLSNLLPKPGQRRVIGNGGNSDGTSSND
jgi:hypothetical protein